MFLRVHLKEGEKVVAVCDEELIGKVLREGELVLNLDKYRGFYVGKLVNEIEVERELKDATSANLVGKRAVGIARKIGLVKDKNVKLINGVPHVQIYRIEGRGKN